MTAATRLRPVPDAKKWNTYSSTRAVIKITYFDFVIKKPPYVSCDLYNYPAKTVLGWARHLLTKCLLGAHIEMPCKRYEAYIALVSRLEVHLL